MFKPPAIATAQTFTFSATTGNYLKALTVNGSDVIGSVTGNLSGSSIYALTSISDSTKSLSGTFATVGA